ncbi:hypothetical protein PG993_006593 [Apiospora rasikravindrae]|uniref:Uncharacterized protein n=1 Tax=Apiospora rasikravindrae TaxID=990691 RepID=A0ABR1T650_9PEZI
MTNHNGWKEALWLWPAKCCCYSIYYPLRGLYLCAKHAKRTPGKIGVAWRRRRIRNRKIPKSKPIAQTQQQKALDASSPASFLHLPLELRLQIYDLALGDACLVEPHLGRPEWHPRPCNWQPGQRIRGDDEEPQSDELRTVLDVRAFGLLYSKRWRVHPDNHDWERFSRYGVPWTWYRSPCYSKLMRTCHTVYDDLLHRLYGENTISLVGAEMLRYFGRNASPEGLGLVRYVHVGLVVSCQGWESRQEQESLEHAVRSLQKLFPKLEQLDLNVTIVGAHPVKPGKFWDWLRMDVLERHLANLQEFRLRVTGYAPGHRSPCLPCPRPWYEQLLTWNEDDYQALKAAVCRPSLKN